MLAYASFNKIKQNVWMLQHCIIHTLTTERWNTMNLLYSHESTKSPKHHMQTAEEQFLALVLMLLKRKGRWAYLREEAQPENGDVEKKAQSHRYI